MFIIRTRSRTRRRMIQNLRVLRAMTCISRHTPYNNSLRHRRLVRQLRITTLIRSISSRSSTSHRMKRSRFNTSQCSRYSLPISQQNMRHMTKVTTSSLSSVVFNMSINTTIMSTIRQRAHTRFVARIMRHHRIRTHRTMNIKQDMLLITSLRTLTTPQSRRRRVMTRVTKRVKHRGQPTQFCRQVINPTRAMRRTRLRTSQIRSHVKGFNITIQGINRQRSHQRVRLTHRHRIRMRVNISMNICLQPRRCINQIRLHIMKFPTRQRSRVPLMIRQRPPTCPHSTHPLRGVRHRKHTRLLPIFRAMMKRPSSLVNTSMCPIKAQSKLRTRQMTRINNRQRISQLPNRVITHRRQVNQARMFQARFRPSAISRTATKRYYHAIHANINTHHKNCTNTHI